MELTKEQYEKRTGALLKAHHWFGSDNFKTIFENYDYYVDKDRVLIYVYKKE